MNIYEKLVDVRKSVKYLQKEMQSSQYKYTGSSQVLAAIRNKIDDLGLLLVPKIVDKNLLTETVEFTDSKTGNPKKTTTYFTELIMTMTWINAEDPTQQVECPWYSQGVDIAGEKGVGKALTYGEKNFILKFFNIATDKDDPDAFQHRFDQQASKELIAKIKAVWTKLGMKANRLDEQSQSLYGENVNQLNEQFAEDFLQKLNDKLNTQSTQGAIA